MANVQEDLLNGFTGKVGDVVIYKAFGKMIVRSMPSKKRAPAPPTQKKGMDGFARAMKLMQACKEFVRIGFKDVAENRSAFHTALSENIKRQHQDTQPDTLHWLLLSHGERAGAKDMELTRQDKQLVVSWQDPVPDMPSSPRDQVMLLALNSTTLETTTSLFKARRSDQNAPISMPPAKKGHKIMVFISFYQPLGETKKSPENVSQSAIVGNVEV